MKQRKGIADWFALSDRARRRQVLWNDGKLGWLNPDDRLAMRCVAGVLKDLPLLRRAWRRLQQNPDAEAKAALDAMLGRDAQRT